MIKIYRASKVLNVLFEICTITLPPFFASSFAVFTVSGGIKGGTDHNLKMTIIFAVFAALNLHVFYQGVKTLEDCECVRMQFSVHCLIFFIRISSQSLIQTNQQHS